MKRFLTNPSKCIDDTCDNEECNLVVAKGDLIVKKDGPQYMVIELLGVGMFGQVFRCVSNEGDEVAIKVVKSQNKFYQYEMNEIRILRKFKELGLTKYYVELMDAFVYKNHLCIVVQLLGRNMYDLVKILRFNGLELYSLRNVLQQVLNGLCILQSMGITHCDLKPENILVSDFYREEVKIIDFGSASTHPMSTLYYVQSRFYRAPEVILGIPYSTAIDIWSLGCIGYELLMGKALFPGSSNGDQIHLIHEFFPGGIPPFMLEHGINTHLYFKKENNGFTGRENSFKFTLQGVIDYIYSKYHPSHDIALFIDLILKMLNPSYLERWSPDTLLKHEFFRLERPSRHRNDENNREGVLNNAKRIDTYSHGQRKLSMFDYGKEEAEELAAPVRKGSVYDPSRENRGNRGA
ncbi:dual specificity protein kinase YAK1 [Pancytospora epiphaga]|nr:dual specificity protein kinase YAK1 [Pancytospora epiphaga]